MNDEPEQPMLDNSGFYTLEVCTTASFLIWVERHLYNTTGNRPDYSQPISTIWRRQLSGSQRKDITEMVSMLNPGTEEQARIMLGVQELIKRLRKRKFVGVAQWIPGKDADGNMDPRFIVANPDDPRNGGKDDE